MPRARAGASIQTEVRAIRRLITWALFLAVPLLLLGVSASRATAPAAKVRPPTPRTLVIANGPIRSFAQSAGSIAWVDRLDRVYVKRLSKPTRWHLGSALGSGNRATYAYAPLLTLIGARAFWTTYDGGNSVEIAIFTAVPGDRHSTLVEVVGSDPDGSGTGSYFSGLDSEGTRLVYGFASIDVPGGGLPTDCSQLALGDRGVALLAGPPYRSGRSSRPAGMPSVMMLAASQALIAVVPATFSGQRCPELQVGENGPVQLYHVGSTATLLTTVAPHGYVKSIGLSPTQLAVLIQRANGPRLIERYDPRSGSIIGTTPVSSSTAFELGISSAGIVYRVRNKILFVGPSGVPKLVWTARARPIGLSIEGKRIAWAENVKGHGRIFALALR
jgi:hypothetical protein